MAKPLAPARKTLYVGYIGTRFHNVGTFDTQVEAQTQCLRALIQHSELPNSLFQKSEYQWLREENVWPQRLITLSQSPAIINALCEQINNIWRLEQPLKIALMFPHAICSVTTVERLVA